MQRPELRFRNTLTRAVERFEPLHPGRVGLYTCGPTVYNFAHLGNFRTYVFEDLLRRVLRDSGLEVTQVMNLTDVDDKTIRGAREAGISLDDYTRPYKDAFFEDLDLLCIERAEQYPAATTHVPQMVELIERLFERGYAYQSDDGSVYYNIRKFAGYGKLSGVRLDDLKPGARVSQDEYEKESLGDFALWKAWSPDDGDVGWDSPWGRGRPGWHIECSAMAMTYLGETFDMHTGGIDNMFPHHEDEIAQSEGATGAPYVRTWLHSAHLIVDGQKMSKSLGNFFTPRDLVERGWSGREIRYVLLGGHYRQTLNFTMDDLAAARSALARVDEMTGKLREIASADADASASMDASASPDVGELADGTLAGFRAGLYEDLNTPAALGALFEGLREANRRVAAGTVDPAAAARLLSAWEEADEVAGCLFGDRADDEIDPRAVDLARRRDEARDARQWVLADELRDQLLELGYQVKDTREGSRLVRAEG